MEKIAKHLTIFGTLAPQHSNPRTTERGELLSYFLSEVNIGRHEINLKPFTYSAISYFLAKIPTRDLYVLKSKMEQARHKGYPPGAIFWLEIKH